jgi:acetyl esterase/lipase
MANTFNLALMYAMLGNGEEAVRALEDGHRRGIFYGKWSLQGAPWDTLSRFAGFRRVLARNDELIAAAQETTTMKLDIVPPAHYTAGRTYPLLLALHGGGENIAQFKPRWTSTRLRGEFIVAYVQSSQVAALDGYHWQDDAITRREVRQAFRQVVADYAVDTTRVVVGGFSSGGYGALLTTLDGTLPAVGFVVLCPEVPGDLNQAGVAEATRRGLRGTLLTTEADGRLDRQRQYAEQLTENGLAVRFVVTPNIGHWYPDDLSRLIDEALAHIDAQP